jgi:diadenosine tetraphosphatase ApaH/serine/threonine PP2A family protein phosphatase
MRTIFVGDVHGCLDELRALLRLVEPRGGDRFVFLGDLVDRGPDSAGVVALVRSTVARFAGSVCVLGNHDKRWLRCLLRGVPTPQPLAPADEQFLRSMPLFHRLPDIGWFAVHGGLFPQLLRHGPLTSDDARFPHPVKRRGDLMEKMAHVRRVSPQGDFMPLGKETTDDAHWSESYDGREGFVAFGHEPSRQPMRGPFALGLDTGCCYGWSLTAAIVNHEAFLARGWDATEAVEIVSVAAQDVYATRFE